MLAACSCCHVYMQVFGDELRVSALQGEPAESRMCEMSAFPVRDGHAVREAAPWVIEPSSTTSMIFNNGF